MGTARELWPLYIGIIVGAVLTSATALLTPFVIARATDTVVSMVQGGPGQVSDLMWLAVLLLVISLANSGLTNFSGFLGDQMSTRLRAILSKNYFHKLLRLPQRYFDSELTGTVISRLNRSITSITDFLQGFSNGFFPTIITLVAVLGITAFYSPWLSLLLIVIYPAFVWLTALTSKKWQVWEHQKNEHYDVAGGRFAEVVGQMRVVKSFVTERHELTAFSQHYDDAVGLTREQSRFWHRMDFGRRVVLDLVFFAVYAIIFVQTARGEYSVGVMVLLIQLVNMARQPVTSMSYWVDMTQRAVVGSQEYFKAMDESDEAHNPLLAGSEISEKALPDTSTTLFEVRGRPRPSLDNQDQREAPSTLFEVRGTSLEKSQPDPDQTSVAPTPVVEFRDVSFGYDEGVTVLRDLDLTINRGERIAFVGESGGGKTTLVNLIMKLYPVSSGEVKVYGQSVNNVPTDALRREIGVVFQDASLFSGTIRENMTYGGTATEEQLWEAACRANAESFIKKLPDSFDTQIGERGIKLSGGQKQRLSVARALLKDAPILILDEATSSLDTKSERAVQAGLEELMEGRTTLIIAHRLSTISTVDRVVTLRDGRIDEVGSPAELATTGGIYAELLALQGSGRKADKAKLRRYDIMN
ncbi:ABC transporter ATP-binding protein [Tessaracoccus sp. HF-7]|nr:ABC transporter ATP-binding protein [Tessaracoccus caeni]MDF1488205.1 ABC transporter ATP-binding protein [Tessaracoccus caeni]